MDMPADNIVAALETLITERRSTRAFLPRPVPRTTLERVLGLAARAPSGANLQPWKVHVVEGDTKRRLERRMLAALDDPDQRAQLGDEYAYYPKAWREPYQGRRRKVGWDLYQLLGIAKGDHARMNAQLRRNHVFFDAPVGLLFTIDRDLGLGSWLDYGMFLQTLMICARAHGLETCPQAAHNQFHRLIAEELDFAPTEQLVCGMALGYRDPHAIENQLQTERDPVAAFTRYFE
jgi:nitroreductase